MAIYSIIYYIQKHVIIHCVYDEIILSGTVIYIET